jgi:hypothetical protein
MSALYTLISVPLRVAFPIRWATPGTGNAQTITAFSFDWLLNVWAFATMDMALRKRARFSEWRGGRRFTVPGVVTAINITSRLLACLAPLGQIAVGLSIAAASIAGLWSGAVTRRIARACRNDDYATLFPDRHRELENLVFDTLAIHVACHMMLAICGMQAELHVRGWHTLSATFLACPVLVCVWCAICEARR